MPDEVVNALVELQINGESFARPGRDPVEGEEGQG